MQPRQIMLATGNPAKQQKLRWLLDGLGIIFEIPDDRRQEPPEEGGASHGENARMKAEAWSAVEPGLAIASDGGLVIPALSHRWNSLHTNRFAGEGASEVEHLWQLLALMEGLAGGQRRAYWREAVALAQNGRLLHWWVAEGGDGVLQERFDPAQVVPGFWVGTIWYFPKLSKLYRDLSEGEMRLVGEPWSRLKPEVQQFFRWHFR